MFGDAGFDCRGDACVVVFEVTCWRVAVDDGRFRGQHESSPRGSRTGNPGPGVECTDYGQGHGISVQPNGELMLPPSSSVKHRCSPQVLNVTSPVRYELALASDSAISDHMTASAPAIRHIDNTLTHSPCPLVSIALHLTSASLPFPFLDTSCLGSCFQQCSDHSNISKNQHYLP